MTYSMGPVRAGRAPYTPHPGRIGTALARDRGTAPTRSLVPISASWPLRRVDSLLLRAGAGDMCRVVVVGQGVMQGAVSVP